MNEAAANTPTLSKRAGSGSFTHVFSGLGLGLLLGVIAGLSVSPVVQTILGALVTLITGFLAFQGTRGEADESDFLDRVNTNELRLGSFAFGAIAGILLGLVIRTHDLFGLPLDQEVQRWTQAGYSREEAQKYVAFQKLGVKPQGMEIVDAEIQKGTHSALMAEDSKIDLCSQLNPRHFADARANIAAFEQQPDEHVSELGSELEKETVTEQKSAVRWAWEGLCAARSTVSKEQP